MSIYVEKDVQEVLIHADALIGEIEIMRKISDKLGGDLRQQTSGLNPWMHDLADALKKFESYIGVPTIVVDDQ